MSKIVYVNHWTITRNNYKDHYFTVHYESGYQRTWGLFDLPKHVREYIAGSTCKTMCYESGDYSAPRHYFNRYEREEA